MTNAKLFFCFTVVLYLFTVAPLCYAGRSRLSQADDLNHSSRLNKRPVKSIKSPDGDIIDCVDMFHQPAFDHPSLKNHTIKMRPNSYPKWINDNGIKVSSMTNASKFGQEPLVQLWHSKGTCPKGTIPIIRSIMKDNPLGVNSVKKSSPFIQPSSDPTFGHEYASLITYGRFFGAKATLNVWNPKVQEPNEFSLAQLWVVGGPSNMNTIEAGWQAGPAVMRGDARTRLFIFWTNNGYQGSGCYNHECSGFIQNNFDIALGGTISPTSQVDGSQYDLTIQVWKDPKDGDWWLQIGDVVIGYWPASLFSYLNDGASQVSWGGEIVNAAANGVHTTTQMGSGQFSETGFQRASYVKNIQTVDETVTLKTPENEDLNTYVKGKGCYDIVKGGVKDNWGSYFFFGGPGRNDNCK